MWRGDVKLQQDKKEVFTSVCRDQLGRLYAIARRLVGPESAEDLTQETLLRAYRSFDALRSPELASGWLRTILINVYRDRLRGAQREVEEVHSDDIESFSLYRVIADEDPFPYSDTLHLDFLKSFSREDVRDVLWRLPEIYRAPLVLVYMEGYATKEVAKLMQAPLGTILARLHRGRKLFERELWAYAEEAGLLSGAAT